MKGKLDNVFFGIVSVSDDNYSLMIYKIGSTPTFPDPV